MYCASDTLAKLHCHANHAAYLVHVILHSLLTLCCALGGKVKRLAVDATLRTAAPYQKSRKARAEAAGKTRKVYVEKVHPSLYRAIDENTSVC